ncbi:MAG: ATP-binding cassette domain-containing protein [Synergistaceae bacterium]|nr:ATP-binding cassette domain-containing protein [Synergistaceae bacterium]MBQ6435519.1 ATP-binding cassette domain-containing protein [Synergistaceae bacterium]MBQ6738440.1 ATP-binding cassette domain-containing protein [Synergistaceae bacterium]MBQ7068949.1 ATP-binding cassette domain-containing protein [Synergistaceae bacterium]MBR0075834.1 ATP-binding cassette domain-containing protein [Synergistaceae bacterium]
MIRLELENAVIKYGDTAIIKNFSLKVESGEMIFVTGSNGSGKSTLIRGIAGLLPLSSGKIFRAERVSYVPQVEEADRNFPATVKEIVLTGTQRKGKLFYTQNDKKLAEKFMKELGIFELSDSKIKTLSGGQLRRVFLARALCGEPELLLLDEPCAGLDAESHKILFGCLQKILEKGCAIIMVTHDDSDLEGIKNSRVIEMSNNHE